VEDFVSFCAGWGVGGKIVAGGRGYLFYGGDPGAYPVFEMAVCGAEKKPFPGVEEGCFVGLPAQIRGLGVFYKGEKEVLRNLYAKLG
jgi:hypothetical protein